MKQLEQRSKRLARDLCKILSVNPTRERFQEITDAIYTELAPEAQKDTKPSLLEVLQQVAARWDKYDNADAPELGAAIRAAIAIAEKKRL